MPEPPRPDTLPLVLACLITLALVLGVMGFCLRVLNAHVRRKEAEGATPGFGDPYRENAPAAPPSAPPEAIVYYIVSFLFWPVAFGLGIHFLRERATIRIGRTCIMIGMGVIALVTVATCVGMMVFALAVGQTVREAPRARPVPTSPPPPPRVAPTSSPVAREQVVRGKVGESLVVGDLIVQLHAVDTSYVPERKSTTVSARKWLAVDVSFRNEGPKSLAIGGHQLQVFDADGYSATAHHVSPKKPALGYATLTPGNLVRGWVTFDLPTDAAPKRIQIRVSYGGTSSIAEIALD